MQPVLATNQPFLQSIVLLLQPVKDALKPNILLKQPMLLVLQLLLIMSPFLLIMALVLHIHICCHPASILLIKSPIYHAPHAVTCTCTRHTTFTSCSQACSSFRLSWSSCTYPPVMQPICSSCHLSLHARLQPLAFLSSSCTVLVLFLVLRPGRP
jgi:hypothetical protein